MTMTAATMPPRPENPVPHLPILRAHELDMLSEERQWLVQGVWTRTAVGVVGGPPKACKSFLALDMAISVATGTPCLDRFDVHSPGPALVYFAEDAQSIVRSRVEALCRHRGIALDQLDLHIITAPSLRIDLENDRHGLVQAIENIRPRLVLLDPLVRLHRLCENDAREMSGLLGFLRDLQRTYDLAVTLVHHSSKRYRSQPGFGLRGSGDIYAIGDSNAYLARRKDGTLLLTLEHRSAPAPDPLLLELAVGDNPHLHVIGTRQQETRESGQPIPDAIKHVLDAADEPMTRGAIREKLKVNNKRLGDALEELERQGIIQRCPAGWSTVEGVQGRLAL